MEDVEVHCEIPRAGQQQLLIVSGLRSGEVEGQLGFFRVGEELEGKGHSYFGHWCTSPRLK